VLISSEDMKDDTTSFTGVVLSCDRGVVLCGVALVSSAQKKERKHAAVDGHAVDSDCNIPP
jgi:hypothetical protein